MVRRPGYIPKKRASGNREINRVLLVSVEGNKNNETEWNYLQYWKNASARAICSKLQSKSIRKDFTAQEL